MLSGRGVHPNFELNVVSRLLKSVLWYFININPKFPVKLPRLVNNYIRLFDLWIRVLPNTLLVTCDCSNNYNSINHIFFLINIKNVFFYSNVVRMQKVLILFVLMTFLCKVLFIRFIHVYNVGESNRLKERINVALKIRSETKCVSLSTSKLVIFLVIVFVLQ